MALVYIYIYIYNVIHWQTVSFLSVARPARCFKPRSRSDWLYVCRIFYPRFIVSLSVTKGIFYIYHFTYSLSDIGVLRSWEEHCISAYLVAGNFPTRVLNPWEGAYVLSSTVSIYIYIYIYGMGQDKIKAFTSTIFPNNLNVNDGNNPQMLGILTELRKIVALPSAVHPP